MTGPVVPLERGYFNDSAERWANRTMSQPSQNNGISYKIYIYLHVCTTHRPNSSRVSASTYWHPNIDPPTSSYSPHSAVSSCRLAPPTPPFPFNPCPRRQRDRVATAWLQLRGALECHPSCCGSWYPDPSPRWKCCWTAVYRRSLRQWSHWRIRTAEKLLNWLKRSSLPAHLLECYC